MPCVSALHFLCDVALVSAWHRFQQQRMRFGQETSHQWSWRRNLHSEMNQREKRGAVIAIASLQCNSHGFFFKIIWISCFSICINSLSIVIHPHLPLPYIFPWRSPFFPKSEVASFSCHLPQPYQFQWLLPFVFNSEVAALHSHRSLPYQFPWRSPLSSKLK